MLTFLALAFMILASVGSIGFAARELAQTRRRVVEFQHGMELRTAANATLGSLHDSDILDDLLQGDDRARAQAALSEVYGDLRTDQHRVSAMARGLSRVPFLAGAASAITIFALERMATESLYQAGVCIAMGMTASLVSQILLQKTQVTLRRFRDTLDGISRQMDRHFENDAHS